MVKKKYKSKRLTLKHKYKIKKKVKEHKRKLRKNERKHPNRKRSRKDPGIPNSIPFKAEILSQIESEKARLEEKQLEMKNKNKQRTAEIPQETLESLVCEANKKLESFNEKQENMDQEIDELKQKPLGEQSRRAYAKEMKKVIENSDVILQVLDARDPYGSRASTVEEAIQVKYGKKIVLVLNKVDLVPKEVVKQWLELLKMELPTVAFKASTQKTDGKLYQHKGDALKTESDTLKSGGSVGTESLMNILKNYCRNMNIKTAITVGVIGYPNVGKSSIINSLKRYKAVGVSSTPGYTKSMQPVQIDKMIKILDCPGVIFDDSDDSSILLKNCINCETLEDPIPAVAMILQRCNPKQLESVYGISNYDPADVKNFLSQLAVKYGKLLKGGIPDRVSVARHVLRDWNSGKVPYYTLPPQGDAENRRLEIMESKLVSTFSEAFDPMTTAKDELSSAPDDSVKLNAESIEIQSLPKATDQWISDESDSSVNQADAMDTNLSSDTLNNAIETKSVKERATEKSTNVLTNENKNLRCSQLKAVLNLEKLINPQVNQEMKRKHKTEAKKKSLPRRQQKKDETFLEEHAHCNQQLVSQIHMESAVDDDDL